MEVMVQKNDPLASEENCLVLGCYQEGQLDGSAARIDAISGGAISHFLSLGDFSGDCGQCQLIYGIPGIPAKRVLLVGLGRKGKVRDIHFQKAAEALGRSLSQAQISEASILLLECPVAHRLLPDLASILVRAIGETQYHFDHHKRPAEKPLRSLEKIRLAVPETAEIAMLEETARAAESALAIGRAVKWARDLANEPGNVCTPSWLAAQAISMANRLGLDSHVLGPAEMEELGMHLLLGVAQGSLQEPRLIVLEYRGGKPDQAPVVLVGKGLTFDAGGISLKPADKMDEMKYDMCGGASALAAIQAAAELQLPLNVVAIVPSSENLPGGSATKPGDIHKGMSGISVEILNTDAEGRLILADALTYAKRFQPDVVVDIATLTGACVIALGHETAAVLGNHEGLVADLLKAGRKSLDRAWELPLFEEYQEQLKSPFADLSNVGGRPAGTITAACFLSRFTEDYRWAHLDIAGVAWKSGTPKGATGRPVPLLVEYLLQRAGQ